MKLVFIKKIKNYKKYFIALMKKKLKEKMRRQFYAK